MRKRTGSGDRDSFHSVVTGISVSGMAFVGLQTLGRGVMKYPIAIAEPNGICSQSEPSSRGEHDTFKATEAGESITAR
jgi:hypothetical protein